MGIRWANIYPHLLAILFTCPVFGQTTPDSTKKSLTDTTHQLDEVQVIGYGQVSKRFNTGSVVTVTAQEIERQPISNPLAALAGRVPGMTVTQTSGNPGAKVNIQIRGQNSISQGSQPLFIIDGVPYSNDYPGTGDIVMGNGGQSPFDNIPTSEIEQIDVLKDADATAIYGSRGANGVVLITTKKGKAGTTKMAASIYQGIGQITRRMDLLNTNQYIAMRKEAFKNDGIEPTAVNAPDLVSWDTTRYTDWQDEFIGGTAHFTNANASLSGGNANTQFLAGGSYNRQTTVYPGEFADTRGAGNVNITHKSGNNRLNMLFSGSYRSDKNELPSDLTNYINLAPNTPRLIDGTGNLVWSENGGAFSNPLSAMYRTSKAVTDNFTGNLNVQFELFKGLNLRTTGGYNLIQFNESYFVPKSSLDPNNSAPVSSSKFANTTNKSWIIEPQLTFDKAWRRNKLAALIGTTIQRNTQQLYAIEASDFPNDALLEATAFARSVTTSTSGIDYRYQAIFGRVNYNYTEKYLLNVTGRRDGSSRFGPGKRLANFGAVGAAWVFSEEELVKKGWRWLSFGKLRGSYGITGNDQIGDYQYLDNYGTAREYEGIVGYIPSRLYNPEYSWERNKKLEAALEAGVAGNRLTITVNWFRNRSDDQLVNYKLPDQVGFPSILSNFNAVVQNTGWEFSALGMLINSKELRWNIAANITINRNKLLKFPDLISSSYANTLVIGQPLTIAKYLHWTGVDPETGLHTFNGTTIPADQTVIANFTPAYYGGINNSISYKHWNLTFLFQFNKQNGRSYLTDIGKFVAGSRYNQPAAVLDRWKKPGDLSNHQRFSTGGVASTAYNYYAAYSDAILSDASFARLKNLYVSYTLHALTIFFQGNNLLTFTGYQGLDPETGSSYLPPMSVYSLGVQITL